MPQHVTYILHIWWGRAIAGRQWVARVECPGDGERIRFADPEALLAHLRSVVLRDLDGSAEPSSVPDATAFMPKGDVDDQ